MLGKGPSYSVVSPPESALPSFSAYVVVPLFFSIAVTNGEPLPLLPGSEPLPPENSPFSMSASTHGPVPVQGVNQHRLPKYTASMCPLPVSVLDVSALPKSKQHTGS